MTLLGDVAMTDMCIGGCGNGISKGTASATYCIDKLVEFVCKECHDKGVRTELERRRESERKQPSCFK